MGYELLFDMRFELEDGLNGVGDELSTNAYQNDHTVEAGASG
ncbi:hypothetical protein [Paraburkholderia terrae]|nr:hypothetical protein [Paraburkholderia terrae]